MNRNVDRLQNLPHRCPCGDDVLDNHPDDRFGRLAVASRGDQFYEIICISLTIREAGQGLSWTTPLVDVSADPLLGLADPGLILIRLARSS